MTTPLPDVGKLLDALRFQTDLLEPVDGVLTALAFHTHLAEGHLCLRCGASASYAFVIDGGVLFGLRWLDLCAACYRDVYRHVAQQPTTLWTR